MQTILLAAAGLFGLAAIILQFFKIKTSDVLKKNEDVKNEVATLNQQVNQNNQSLDSEAAKRAQIEADLKKQEEANVTQKELLDFVNDKPSNNK